MHGRNVLGRASPPRRSFFVSFVDKPLSIRTSRVQIVLAVVAVAAVAGLAGSYARRSPTGRCALDGAVIEPIYRVRIVDELGQDRLFCCIRCAELWLEARPEKPRAIFVTDEASGAEVPAEQAFFVRSAVVTTPTTRNRVHAFRERYDAERHAATAHGRLLTGEPQPLAPR